LPLYTKERDQSGKYPIPKKEIRYVFKETFPPRIIPGEPVSMPRMKRAIAFKTLN